MINKWLQSDRNASQNKLIASIKLATVTPQQISLTHKILNGMELLLNSYHSFCLHDCNYTVHYYYFMSTILYICNILIVVNVCTILYLHALLVSQSHVAILPQEHYL